MIPICCLMIGFSIGVAVACILAGARDEPTFTIYSPLVPPMDYGRVLEESAQSFTLN